MTPRIAVPSRGRLRDGVVSLLDHAGYRVGELRGTGARSTVGGLELIEMRPRDAAAWLAAGRIDGAFLSSDLVLEEELGGLPSIPLSTAQSDLVVASRDDDGRTSAEDLAGAVVATHLPGATERWFASHGVDVTVVAMGGALEGVCAAGLADAIVDLRQTGTSLSQNRLRVLAEIASCEGLFVHGSAGGLDDVRLRLHAALEAARHRYVMVHLPPARVGDLAGIFPGLAAPTVLPLSGRGDLVAVHLVVTAADLWSRLGELQALGATGIVATTPEALVA